MSKILIIEDYPNLQTMYKKAMEAEGYEVWTAKDGDEALSLVQSHEPDLILLDLLLPNRGGLEFLRGFNLLGYSHTKVIVMSNMSSPELLSEAKDLGVSQYLVKVEHTPKQVAEIIKSTLAS